MTGFEKEGQTCTRVGCLSVRNLKGRPGREVEAGGLLSWLQSMIFFLLLYWAGETVQCVSQLIYRLKDLSLEPLNACEIRHNSAHL